MVGPGKGPGISFKFLVKLHPQQVTRDGQVITERQHKILREKIFCKLLPQPGSGARRQNDEIRTIGFCAAFDFPATVPSLQTHDPVRHNFRTRIPGAPEKQLIQRGAGINRQGRAQMKAYRRARGSDELRVVQQISAARRLRQEGVTPQGFVTKPAATRFLPADLFFENENPTPAAARPAETPALGQLLGGRGARRSASNDGNSVRVHFSNSTANSSWSVQKRGIFLDDRMKSSSAKSGLQSLRPMTAQGKMGRSIKWR